ncbi:MAG TPA: hypothetical protein EYP41_20835 [Anaerolineae bacterium]|nr:hypothetical protein [Anaerolineae bacterium]HIP73397.1 hypothetical protein [Anaerolineae bacterium]
MIIGIFVFIASLFLLGKLLPAKTVPAEDISLIVASLVGGSIGAVVSMMWRMIKGDMTVRYDVKRRTLILVGLFRPLVGAVFGLLIFALIQTELLPIEVKSDNLLYFFGIIGFMAGFSERWAPDLLQTTQDKLNNGSIVEPTANDSTQSQAKTSQKPLAGMSDTTGRHALA